MAFEEDPVKRKMAREAILGSARAGKSVKVMKEWLRRASVNVSDRTLHRWHKEGRAGRVQAKNPKALLTDCEESEIALYAAKSRRVQGHQMTLKDLGTFVKERFLFDPSPQFLNGLLHRRPYGRKPETRQGRCTVALDYAHASFKGQPAVVRWEQRPDSHVEILRSLQDNLKDFKATNLESFPVYSTEGVPPDLLVEMGALSSRTCGRWLDTGRPCLACDVCFGMDLPPGSLGARGGDWTSEEHRGYWRAWCAVATSIVGAVNCPSWSHLGKKLRKKSAGYYAPRGQSVSLAVRASHAKADLDCAVLIENALTALAQPWRRAPVGIILENVDTKSWRESGFVGLLKDLGGFEVTSVTNCFFAPGGVKKPHLLVHNLPTLSAEGEGKRCRGRGQCDFGKNLQHKATTSRFGSERARASDTNPFPLAMVDWMLAAIIADTTTA